MLSYRELVALPCLAEYQDMRDWGVADQVCSQSRAAACSTETK